MSISRRVTSAELSVCTNCVLFLDAATLNGVPSPVLASLHRSAIVTSAVSATCNIGVDLSRSNSCNLTLFVQEYAFSRILDNTRVV